MLFSHPYKRTNMKTLKFLLKNKLKVHLQQILETQNKFQLNRNTK